MIFKLIPLEGTDIIKLGMSSLELQSKTGMNCFRLKKTKWRMFETEQFDCFQTEYDENNICISLQFFDPARVYLGEYQLIGRDYLEVEQLFKSIDSELIYEDGCGFVSRKLQIGIFADGEPLKVEAVLVAKKDYYI